MLSDAQLFRHTVERRISIINMVIESQMHPDFQACEYFSVVLDESCDIQDKPRLAIFAQFISTDYLIKEELLDIGPLKVKTRCIDMKEVMVATIEKVNLRIAKLTVIITDGAPPVIGSVNKFMGLCKANQTFPEFWSVHCIIDREQLYH